MKFMNPMSRTPGEDSSADFNPSIEDRAVGALLGLALCDALGTALEFRPPGTFEPIDDIVGGGPFGLEPGQWTDDTSMALCLADSLIGQGGFDAEDQMHRYVGWWRNGDNSVTGTCFDIGNTVAGALGRFERTGEPFAGSSDPNSAGNGSLMRLAPVALAAWPNPEKTIQWAGESSRTTHGAPTCISACQYFAAMLHGALDGVGKQQLVGKIHEPQPGIWQCFPLAPEIREIAEGSFRRKNPPEIKGSGYVVESLEAALWAFHQTDDFRSGALAAVNLGDDADTTGAIYGQIAGAHYGRSGLPKDWLAKLHWREEIAERARRLIA